MGFLPPAPQRAVPRTGRATGFGLLALAEALLLVAVHHGAHRPVREVDAISHDWPERVASAEPKDWASKLTPPRECAERTPAHVEEVPERGVKFPKRRLKPRE
jgi:hypothetical protein